MDSLLRMHMQVQDLRRSLETAIEWRILQGADATELEATRPLLDELLQRVAGCKDEDDIPAMLDIIAHMRDLLEKYHALLESPRRPQSGQA
jgi:hypothetical protein